MNHALRVLFFIVSFIYSTRPSAQAFDSIIPIIELDSISIEATKQEDLNINEFISLMIHDTSLFSAFKNLRTVTYVFRNSIEIFKRDRKTIQGAYYSKADQEYTAPCRSMKEHDVRVVGDYFDGKAQYKWYTSKLYDRLFFTHGKVCIDPTLESTESKSTLEKHIQELKKLIFSPGTRSHVPLLGDKTAIFDEDMKTYYDYRFRLDTIQSQPYYLFEVEVKPEYKSKAENKTVVKKLQTWFSIDSHQVVRRDYWLTGNTIAYSFEVAMHVELIKVQDRYFPANIQYDGTWKIVTRKRESAKFTISFSDFKL